MALAGALSLPPSGACGLTNKSLRALTARLLGTPYSASQMTYDLHRLRLNGLIVTCVEDYITRARLKPAA